MQSEPAADEGTSDIAHAWSTKGATAAENSDSPITPLQADPAYPQRHRYTPSEAGPSTGAKPSIRPESMAKHAQQGNKGEPGGQTQPVLEGIFDQVDRNVAGSVDDNSSSSISTSERSPQQQQSAAANAANSGTSGHVQAQLSPSQSCPSTPASQIGHTHGSDDAYRSVTHVNSCFAKSDDEGEHDDILSSSSTKSSQLAHVHDETDAADTVQHNDEDDQSLSISDKLQSRNHDLKAALKAKAQVNTAAFSTKS